MGNRHKGNLLYSHKSLCSNTVEQVLVVAFGIIHVGSSLNIVIFPYAAPADAHVLELAIE